MLPKIFLEIREVVERVRIDRANGFRHDKPARKLGKGSRWLLLKNSSNLNVQQTVSLEELLRVNQPLSTIYIWLSS
jgi:transposase